MTKKISIIMPVYNAEQYLREALDSIFAQTLQEIELVAVNDGSTDNSLAILQQYSKKYSDKMEIIDKPNSGASDSRNIAISMAKGKWILFCDADDTIEPDTCKYLLNLVEQHQADIATFAYKRTNFDGKAFGEIGVNCPTSGVEVLNTNEIFSRWYLPLLRLTPSDFFKSHGYMAINLFSADIINNNRILQNIKLSVHEDELFLLEYLPHARKAVITNKPLYNYRFSQNSLTSTFYLKSSSREKAEITYYELTKARRKIWEDKFRYIQLCKFSYDSILGELFATEILHLARTILSKNDLSLCVKFKNFKSAMNNLKDESSYNAMIQFRSKFLSLKKRAFAKLISYGNIPTFSFCAVMFFLTRKSGK